MIDTKALCSRVLELAIQGKLTEQLVEDGTGEELYAEIQAEKQRMIKEGKLKKEKHLINMLKIYIIINFILDSIKIINYLY